MIVFLSSVEHVEKCAQALRKIKKHNVATLTGTMRGAERDELLTDPVFARFLPRADAGVKPVDGTVFLIATSAGEVGIDVSADHLVTDLPPFDALAQRLGRVNRYGEGDAEVHVYCEALKQSRKGKVDGTEQDDEEDTDGKPGRQKEQYEEARFHTRQLLSELPQRDDARRDASPSALRSLPRVARSTASTPLPVVSTFLVFPRDERGPH